MAALGRDRPEDTPQFLKDHSRLPPDIQRLFAVQEQRFHTNRFDPRLHFQKLVDVPGVYSLRVTRRYRVMLRFDNPNEAVFFAIGHRKDAYR